MKRLSFRLSIAALLLLVTAVSSGITLAQELPPQPTVDVLCPHVLKPGVPFAWLRTEPSSFAGYAVTLRPGETVQLNNPLTLSWDTVQWWVYVWPNASPARGYYWVELSSLEPRCQGPTPTPIPGKAPWNPGDRVRVRLNVPFVWFRGAPAPGNSPIHTVLPGAQLVIVQGASTDVYNQWWWQMRDLATGITGWVEQNSVELVAGPPPTVPPPIWQPGDTVRIRSQVPFSWLRTTPSSHADILFTVYPTQELFVRKGPQHDGVQNWWQVVLPNTAVVGWVEEGSLQFVRRGS